MNTSLIKSTLIRIYYYFFKRRTVTHNYSGIKLNVYLENPASESWYDTDWKRLEIDFLKKHLKLKGSTVFNIGSHEGIVSLIFSKLVTTRGKVIAVEMDHNHTKVANINKSLNQANNIQIINSAVSNTSGYLSYSDDQVIQISNSVFKSNAKTVTIDELTISYGVPNLIYMDIEGFEYNAMLGAKKTLMKLPSFCIEVHSNHGLEKYNGSVNSIIRMFPKNIYKLYISKAVHDCKFVTFNINNKLLKDRFYLVAIPKK